MENSKVAVLSLRDYPFVGWVAIDEFEDLLARVSGCQILAPSRRPNLPKLFERIRNRTIGKFAPIGHFSQSRELLIVVARSPADLQIVHSISNVRKSFRNIAAFVIDSYFIDAFNHDTKLFDHVFTTTEEGADAVRQRFGVASSVLRQGFDCLNWACVDEVRSIDLVGFGRQPPGYHHAFQDAFHRVGSPVLYLHSPIGTISGDAVRKERPMLIKLLQRSKVSLAFHLGVQPQNSRPISADFVTSRWFESLAAGCIVAGKKPPGSMAKEMFPWPDATIELPDDPVEAAEVIVAVTSNSNSLNGQRMRNVVEMCSRHDWRYRIREIYEHFNVPLPPPLISELEQLNTCIKRLRASDS
ncbi:glycosyltransferase family 1 protein [Bradyrhizobium manausense]|uniref:glycosyltransferase n=1 Tax=Bradyrhizobium manausense TaxID=989370 RepID=UPI001BAC91A1|nr:glycosyltransferase [Bradyrhizobium manausense]MBR0836974.1 glycosyltransferase family 1 protein [Bradyrhizobium manausense]